MIDREEVQAMIKAEIDPLHLKIGRARNRVKVLEKRVAQTERDIQSVKLLPRLFEESFGRLEEKIDRQQQEILRRMDPVEGWIGGQRRLVKVATRAGQMAVIMWLRRWLPFVGLFGVMLVLWWTLVNVMGVL